MAFATAAATWGISSQLSDSIVYIYNLLICQQKKHVRFFGSVHYAPGDWLGVELEAPMGKNNGTIKGVEYFKCPSQHGMMVRPSEVTLSEDD